MAIVWTQQVFSSNVSEVSYDDETQDMFVTFQKNGAKYVYRKVPPDVAQNLANAPSVGSMLRSDIQPNYSYSRIS